LRPFLRLWWAPRGFLLSTPVFLRESSPVVWRLRVSSELAGTSGKSRYRAPFFDYNEGCISPLSPPPANNEWNEHQELREMIDAGSAVSSLEMSIFECADLFKQWLRSLPEAVIPDNLTLLYIGCAQASPLPSCLTYLRDCVALTCVLVVLFGVVVADGQAW